MKPILTLLMLFTCGIAGAQIFKRVGPDGTVHFSDQPDPEAHEIEVASPPTVTLPPVSRGIETAGEQGQPESVYAVFAIASPGSEDAIRANDGNVTVQLSVEPELRPGHTITLVLDGEDGETVKAGDALSIGLSNLSRGRHTVEAAIVDESGEILNRTTPVSFDVLRVASGNR